MILYCIMLHYTHILQYSVIHFVALHHTTLCNTIHCMKYSICNNVYMKLYYTVPC